MNVSKLFECVVIKLQFTLQLCTVSFRCPLLLQLDVLQFTRQLLNVEMRELALSCALLITAADVRLAALTDILHSVDQPTDVFRQLAEWRNMERPLPLEEQVVYVCVHVKLLLIAVF